MGVEAAITAICHEFGVNKTGGSFEPPVPNAKDALLDLFSLPELASKRQNPKSKR
jgi:hypothetical protein